MPPETLPWERFKDRRYVRPPPPMPEGLGPVNRWREPPPAYNGFRPRPPGNGRQGPWRCNSAESGHGFASPRVDDRFIDDERFRQSGFRMDGRYNRFDRDSKGPFGPRIMRGNSWQNDMSSNSSGRLHFDCNMRSVDERATSGPKDLKSHSWENGRLQNVSDQRPVDQKGSFGRKNLRGKSRENGVFPASSGRLNYRNDQCSADDKAPFEKKNLKRRSPENGSLPNSVARLNVSNDKGSPAQTDMKANSSSKLHIAGDQSSRDDKDIKGQYVESGVVSTMSEGLHSGNNPSHTDDMLKLTSPTHSEHSKDQCDKSSSADDLALGRKIEKDNSLAPIDWKPLKWNRSASLSSRGQKSEIPSSNGTPFRSPSGDSTACVSPLTVSSDEAGLRKKPRLGWGEGLAKFEKKKVEGPVDDSATKPGLVVCVSGEPSHDVNLSDKSPSSVDSATKPGLVVCVGGEPSHDVNLSGKSPSSVDDIATKPGLVVCVSGEPSHDANLSNISPSPVDDSATKPGLVVCVSGEPSHDVNLSDKSPRAACFLECASPATHSSIACSSSPGIGEKACAKASTLYYDASSNGSPNLLLQEDVEVNQEKTCVDNVELTSVAEPNSSSEKPATVEASCIDNVELTSVADSSLEKPAKVEASCLDNVELTSVADSSLEKPATVEANSERSTALNKLLVWRGETLKALEATELEIDSLENDLKKLVAESKIGCTLPDTLSPALGYFQEQPCENKNDEGCDNMESASSPDSIKNVEGCDNMEIVVSENLEECPMYGSNDGSSEGLSVLKGDGDSVGALSCDSGGALSDRILTLNKDTAAKANEVFERLLSSNHSSNHAWGTSSISSWKDMPRIMEKIAFKKRSRIFEERASALKYRALRYLWKEDLESESSRKNRPKSHKKLEASSRGSHYSNPKHRLSLRSQFSNAAGNLSLAPTADAINFAAKLLSGPQMKPFRNSLKMPALIGKEERVASRFISSNGLVEDPFAVEKERALINPWTKEEEEIFMDKFVTFGKDFSKISSFLDHKTTADCVEFYYKNHKSDSFVKKPKKQPEVAKQGKSFSFNNYLVGSGKRWDGKKRAASLDVLGEASAFAARADRAMETLKEASGSEAAKTDGLLEKSHDLNVSVNERETEAADVLAGIGSISPEAMGSCITSSFDRGQSNKNKLTNQKVGTDDNGDDNDDSCSDDSRGEVDSTDWTDEEKCIFLQAFTTYGKDFAMISRRVRTKSRNQCNVFYSKAKKSFGLDMVHPRPLVQGGDDENVGSDMEVACVLEADPVGDESVVVPPNPTTTVLPPEENADKKEENTLNDWQEESGNGLRDLNGVAQDLLSRDDALNVPAGSPEVVMDSGIRIKQDEKIQIDLNPSLNWPDISLMSNSCHVSSNPSSVSLSHEQRKSHVVPYSGSRSSDSEKPKGEGNGDVMLFGQILKSRPSGSRNSAPPQNNHCELGGSYNIDLNSLVGKSDYNNYFGLDKMLPTRFLDGSRYPTGFPSVPDSALLMAKYPVAFGNLSNAFNVEQQQLVNNRSHSHNYLFSGSSVFPARNQLEFVSEPLVRNGIGAFSSLQNPMAGVGISDPVTAIQMHYAAERANRGKSWER